MNLGKLLSYTPHFSQKAVFEPGVSDKRRIWGEFDINPFKAIKWLNKTFVVCCHSLLNINIFHSYRPLLKRSNFLWLMLHLFYDKV